ncbi:YhdT family protein [Heyndrickxia acidiproducens]|uniref:YhdT family protein n=1 Tax=Heyndrickxia acidiproducens TaxID=1121084 RepID=UPI00035E39C6|nr:YhdT family protein [Heyndrickxia acidiproducens]
MKKQVETEDKRFKVAHREALIGIGLVIFNFLWWYGFAYGFGSKPVKSYHYVFGMPAWFFYSCIAGYIVVVILVIILVKFFFHDIPFEEEEDEKGDQP